MKKATKSEEIPEIRCLYRRQEVKKATKSEEIPKIRCLYRQQEAKKATKIEEIPEIRCPTYAFPKKARSQKGNNPKKAPNNKAAAPWCGCPALYSFSNYC